MRPGTTAVRSWAEAILRQLGVPTGHTLEVTAGAPDGPGAPEPGPAHTSTLRLRPGGKRAEDAEDGGAGGRMAGQGAARHGGSVSVTLAFGDGSAVSVLLAEGPGEAEAVAHLAGQLQEAVLETAGGTPVPPCPGGRGHGHPPTADVVAGTACWVCPAGGGTRPILSGASGTGPGPGSPGSRSGPGAGAGTGARA
ncbi:hypothetical protein KBZ10_03715 [Streptomyces sp. F63]|uniref:hypothetical protein n=1 Tax=Streptomyces sp. F63 TaxID=2824887 RepID=UPI001B383EA0|nr:hypothetical protein [Streptomyces sp. F63]MBQ0983644.1 hypothetical protein [Streptomyces sp. F63]